MSLAGTLFRSYASASFGVFLLALRRQHFDDQLLIGCFLLGIGLDPLFVLPHGFGAVSQAEIETAYLLERQRILFCMGFQILEHPHYLVTTLAPVVVLGQ